MVDILATPPAFERAFGDSRLRMWLQPDVVVSRIEGHFGDEVATAFMDQASPLIRASKRFVGLHDWTEAATFDVMVPPRMAAWTIGLLPHIARIVIATEHPLVSMAVRTTNLTIRRIEHLASREQWLDAVRHVT